MKQVRGWHSKNASTQASAGFTLLELIVVVAIILIMTAIAFPLLQSSMAAFRLRGAVSSITGVIQSTRYQAIMQGIPYQVVFDATGKTYQIKNQPGASFVNVCSPSSITSCPVPLSGSGSTVITLDASKTLTFSPGGKVTPATIMKITYPGKPVETITVSSYGNINVTP